MEKHIGTVLAELTEGRHTGEIFWVIVFVAT